VKADRGRKRSGAEDRRRLKKAHKDSSIYVETHDTMNYEKANARFHELLYDGCLNRYLRQQILAIRRRTQVYRRAHFTDPRRIEKSWQDHQRVVDAILAGDEDAVSRAMIDHIAIGGQEFAEFVAHIPDGLVDV